MTDRPATLDPLTLPLRGSRLIEASAGTGKTWTIAALVLRLVLGHGTPRALMPGEILVMTFTKAATRELSERIRQRLVQAAACFRGEIAPPEGDGFLADLLASYAEGAGEGGRAAAAWRLAMAAEAMDDAAVHTLDAWCQRMLREHAFDSGCLFDEELQADESAQRDEAARDYWRQQVYPLADEPLAVVLGLWPDVQALLRSAQPLLAEERPPEAGPGTLAEALAQATARRQAALAALKAGWGGRAAAMRAWLDPLWDAKAKPIDGRKLGPAHGRRWLEVLAAWAADPAADRLELGAGALRLTPAGVREALKAPRELPPVFADFEALMADLSRLPDPEEALRRHAAAHIAQRLQALKAQAGTFGFADLLARLDDALDEATQGAAARRLRQRILAQYPVALVDEFQDTSPRQLSILDRLYGIANADDATRTLLMIGDPKQAIYGFRGADIHCYLRARRATVGRHHVLGTNHRSTQALVAAVNGCFAAAEARPGPGAFLFRTGGGDSELPFVAVAAQGRAERFVSAEGEVPALSFDLDPELRGRPDSRERHAARGAERVVRWLADPAAGFAEDGAPLRRLRPADIAVLVRTGREAALVRRALRRRGVASVYLSDKDSVLATGEARDLLRLLQAVAAPRDVRRARAALATSLVGLGLDELLALAVDDERFDARCELLDELRRVWQSRGVLAMLRQALHGLDLPARWLAGDGAAADGERRLTNVLHLAELLQVHSAQCDGEQALIRWLAQQLDDAAAGLGGMAADEQVLRLESDADLVKVVTVHKSKGLEYPLVLLPFAAHFRAQDARGAPVVVEHDAAGARQLVLTPSAEQIAAADEDRLREDLRLLYVAFTRARHALWVGAAALKPAKGEQCLWHRSALGVLVSGGSERAPQGIEADLRALAAAVPGVRVEVASGPAGSTRLPAPAAAAPLRAAPAYDAVFDRSWSIGSYSSLVRAGADDARTPSAPRSDGPLRPLRDDEPLAEEGEDAAARRLPSPLPWHRFPRGALAGNFLHGQLEWLAGEGFALDGAATLQAALRRRCERQGWGHRADDVVEWLRRVCSTPVAALGTSLAGLDRVLPEMEFWLPIDALRARAVDDLCREHILPGRPRPELPERAMHGLLMGFADLVYEHDGRYGVLDHKSNALGLRDADYTPAAMEAAMLEHRYDVQAALYLLALHRLLRARLGAAYAPARQLHGAVYLFLRGVGGAGGGGWHLAPPLALIEALDALVGAGREVVA